MLWCNTKAGTVLRDSNCLPSSVGTRVGHGGTENVKGAEAAAVATIDEAKPWQQRLVDGARQPQGQMSRCCGLATKEIIESKRVCVFLAKKTENDS